MPDYTTNLKLQLPYGSKYWNYDTWNSNMNILDAASKDIKHKIVIEDLSASDIISNNSNVQAVLDSLAQSKSKNYYEFVLENDTTVSIPNYANVHVRVITKGGWEYPSGIPKLDFIKSIDDSSEFKIQGGRYYGAEEMIIPYIESPFVKYIKLGDVWYYRLTRNDWYGGILYIDKANDPFFRNIVAKDEVPAGSTDYYYTDEQGNNILRITNNRGVEAIACVDSLNYGWYPNIEEQHKYDFNFMNLNCIWTVT